MDMRRLELPNSCPQCLQCTWYKGQLIDTAHNTSSLPADVYSQPAILMPIRDTRAVHVWHQITSTFFARLSRCSANPAVHALQVSARLSVALASNVLKTHSIAKPGKVARPAWGSTRPGRCSAPTDVPDLSAHCSIAFNCVVPGTVYLAGSASVYCWAGRTSQSDELYLVTSPGAELSVVLNMGAPAPMIKV